MSVSQARPDAEPRPLGPDTLCWDYVGEYRSLLGAGRALLLQVAHPVVAGGVDEHSDFKQRPWKRLQRTIDAVMVFTYGGEDARAGVHAGASRPLAANA